MGEEVLDGIIAYSISLIPFFGDLYLIGFCRNLMKNGRIRTYLKSSLKYSIKILPIFLGIFVLINLFFFFLLTISFRSYDPVLIRKYPEIFLYPALKKLFLLFFLKNLLIYFSILILSFGLSYIVDVLLDYRSYLIILPTALLQAIFNFYSFPLKATFLLIISLRFLGERMWKDIRSVG